MVTYYEAEMDAILNGQLPDNHVSTGMQTEKLFEPKLTRKQSEKAQKNKVKALKKKQKQYKTAFLIKDDEINELTKILEELEVQVNQHESQTRPMIDLSQENSVSQIEEHQTKIEKVQVQIDPIEEILNKYQPTDFNFEIDEFEAEKKTQGEREFITDDVTPIIEQSHETQNEPQEESNKSQAELPPAISVEDLATPPYPTITPQLTLQRTISQDEDWKTKDQQIYKRQSMIREKVQEKKIAVIELQSQCWQVQDDLVSTVSQMIPRLGSNRFTTTKKFMILPGYKCENKVTYPDLLTLSKKSISELQPFQMGVSKFSTITQFGEEETNKVGQRYEKKYTKIQSIIDQNQTDQKITKIEYNWQMYETNQNIIIHYTIKFYSHDDTILGEVSNLTDEEMDKVMKFEGVKSIKEQHEIRSLKEEEYIVGIKLGIRESASIVSIQFILTNC